GDLLSMVSANQLTEERLFLARQELVTYLGGGQPSEEQASPEVAQPAPHPRIFLPPPFPTLPEVLDKETYEATLERYEREFIAAALQACEGRFKETWQMLGVAP